jgi:hypothetical protein
MHKLQQWLMVVWYGTSAVTYLTLYLGPVLLGEATTRAIVHVGIVVVLASTAVLVVTYVGGAVAAVRARRWW